MVYRRIFQSTHPRGVRQSSLRAKTDYCLFQSTHPRGVRRRIRLCPPVRDTISIHAPTWGATRPLPRLLLFYFISIHAPTWGATRSKYISWLLVIFQSTHPRGVRPATCIKRFHSPQFQSTHPRGVRRPVHDQDQAGEQFQSTHPRGVRRNERGKLREQERFQSTHPRGVRLSRQSLFS